MEGYILKCPELVVIELSFYHSYEVFFEVIDLLIRQAELHTDSLENDHFGRELFLFCRCGVFRIYVTISSGVFRLYIAAYSCIFCSQLCVVFIIKIVFCHFLSPVKHIRHTG